MLARVRYLISYLAYRTRAIKGRADYSKIIFLEFSAASNQERLQFKKYFLDLESITHLKHPVISSTKVVLKH